MPDEETTQTEVSEQQTEQTEQVSAVEKEQTIGESEGTEYEEINEEKFFKDNNLPFKNFEDFVKSYKELHASHTRTSQENAELKRTRDLLGQSRKPTAPVADQQAENEAALAKLMDNPVAWAKEIVRQEREESQRNEQEFGRTADDAMAQAWDSVANDAGLSHFLKDPAISKELDKCLEEPRVKAALETVNADNFKKYSPATIAQFFKDVLTEQLERAAGRISPRKLQQVQAETKRDTKRVILRAKQNGSMAPGATSRVPGGKGSSGEAQKLIAAMRAWGPLP